jgi:CRP-like cAMP-binding protein
VGQRYLMPAGAVPFRQGEPAHHVLLLDSGQALLRRAERSGVNVAVALCDAGSFLGLASVLHGAPHAVSACMNIGGEVVAIPASRVVEALASPELRPAVVAQLASDHVGLIERYAARTALSVRDRVLAVLRDLTARSRHLPAVVELSTGDLASLVGCDNSHVCRVLRALRSEGLIDFSRGRVAVRSRFD